MTLNNHRILLVGISGKKRHGKDSFAHFVRNEFAFPLHVHTRPLAAALKEECAEFVADELRKSTGDTGRCIEILAAMNSCHPSHKEPYRLLLQWWGTEFRRNMCAKDYWLVQHERWLTHLAAGQRDDHPIVVLVPDVRFPDEKTYIQSRGGVVVRIERPGMPEGDAHPSETALDDCRTFDHWVSNEGNLYDLASKAVRFRDWLKKEQPWIGQ